MQIAPATPASAQPGCTGRPLPRNYDLMCRLKDRFPGHFDFYIREDGSVRYTAYPTRNGQPLSFAELDSDEMTAGQFDTPAQLDEIKRARKERIEKRKDRVRREHLEERRASAFVASAAA